MQHAYLRVLAKPITPIGGVDETMQSTFRNLVPGSYRPDLEDWRRIVYISGRVVLFLPTRPRYINRFIQALLSASPFYHPSS
jgi:hypothetical protein